MAVFCSLLVAGGAVDCALRVGQLRGSSYIISELVITNRNRTDVMSIVYDMLDSSKSMSRSSRSGGLAIVRKC
eukprot:scaffold84956_cov70-Attheya_sp.AAC.1